MDLLLSDIGLPGGMTGKQLVDAARAPRPQLEVILITGYAQEAADARPGGAAHRAAAQAVLIDVLLRKVQEVLGHGPGR